jgi:hypothetical protein
MHTVPGLKDALDGKRYKAVLLDQFGVMHDGRKAHASAISTVRELHARGVSVYILSNSSRRSTGCISKLETMGFEPQWIAGITLPVNFHHHHLYTSSSGRPVGCMSKLHKHIGLHTVTRFPSARAASTQPHQHTPAVTCAPSAQVL